MQCKWVYRNKVTVDGSGIKYKDRLVSKLFSQVQGVDYTETIAPVANMGSIGIISSIVACKRREVHLMDVKSDLKHG